MSFFIKSILSYAVIISISLTAPFVYAQQAPQDNQSQDQEVKNLLDQFHHEIEHSADTETKSKLHALLSEWKNNFNLYRIFMDTHRWTQMKYYQDARKSEYIRNFPVLASFYFLSHSLEMLSGPIGVYTATELGLGSTAKVVIGAVGAIISVPGLDPLCILFFAISPRQPVQKMFTGIRLAAVKVSGVVSNKLGLRQAMQKIFENKDRLAEIVKASNGKVNLVYDSNKDSLQKQMLLRSKGGKPYLALNFKAGTPSSGKEKTFVESLQVLDADLLGQNKSEVDRILSQFNLSARAALRQALHKPRQTFYVESLETENESTKIQFKDYAVLVKPRTQLRSLNQSETAISPLTCKSLFH